MKLSDKYLKVYQNYINHATLVVREALADFKMLSSMEGYK